MFDLLDIYIEGDILKTFVNLVSFVVACDIIGFIASLLGSFKRVNK